MRRLFGLMIVVVLIISIIGLIPACGDKEEKGEDTKEVEAAFEHNHRKGPDHGS